jgi:predicted ATPase
MITKLVLERFKNFEKAEITLGPLTVLIGANATGKSNLREAFRFLHGIGRGYTFAEILGEKYGPGGELVWKGIRGGPREVAYRGAETFALETTTAKSTFKSTEFPEIVGAVKYRIEIAPGYQNDNPKLVQETLYLDDVSMFEARCAQTDPSRISLTLLGEPVNSSQARQFRTDSPLLPQIAKSSGWNDTEKQVVSAAMFMGTVLAFARFLDPVPEAMRQPSSSSQSILGDRGEHLASVLQIICVDTKRKQALINQVRELTPMDVVDFEFLTDYSGKVLLILEEENGQRVSAYSASDGTLRFLAILAALLSPQSTLLNFFEELETGLHPTRLYLLLDFIEKQTEKEPLQVITTSHSPQMLRFLNAKSRDHVAVMYRLPGSPAAHIKQLRDFPPEARKVIESKDLAKLHDSGWFETVALFMQGEEYSRNS